MNDITTPLRLAVGSHQAGSGRGCAMNVISWENGDSTITDYPECAARHLAALVQVVNDSYCSHRDEHNMLCPACSVTVLALAHRTVGTAGASDETIYAWTAEALDSLTWGAVRFADEEGVAVLRRTADLYLRAADGDMPGVGEWSAAQSAAQSAARSAAESAACSAAESAALMEYAHAAIDAWERITGTTSTPVDETVISDAVTRMAEVR